jgi:glycosyltransferase involved in cell wall biosynthesis
VQPGDPLPVLQKADVFVHPSYEDGFGYAPMEALACGVPVVVTEDTGMKEYVRDGVNGFIVPTGSVDAIVAALRHLARQPFARCSSLLSDSVDPALSA